MFESTRKKKKDKKHLIGSAVVADHAAVEMTEKANVEYHKPKYSSQNRKKFYDNHSALNKTKLLKMVKMQLILIRVRIW